MNIYDVALDFLLLDAFDDLADPPQALSSALQNSWFSEWMKQSVSSVITTLFNVIVDVKYSSLVYFNN